MAKWLLILGGGIFLFLGLSEGQGAAVVIGAILLYFGFTQDA